jgi:hypothetical protein
VFHKQEIAVKEETLQVADGQVLTFDEGGERRTDVSIPPLWEKASPPGRNQGAAGIAFACDRNRRKVTGREARNIRVKPYRPLHKQ